MFTMVQYSLDIYPEPCVSVTCRLPNEC